MQKKTQPSTSFREKVLCIVKTIRKGQALTYKEVATQAGNPMAARAVGAIMRTNYDSKIPCHRVIRTNGGMGGYNRGGPTRKKRILKSEGYTVSA